MKKSKLYKLVQDSLKEVLNEQRDREKAPNPLKDIPDPRVPGQGIGVTGGLEADPIRVADIGLESDEDPIPAAMVTQQLGSFPIWEIDSDGNCQEKIVDGIWVCSMPGYWSDDEDDDQSFCQPGNLGVAGISWGNEDYDCFPQDELSGDNWADFQDWVTGNFLNDDPSANNTAGSLQNLIDENTGIGGTYISQTCPACYLPDLESVTGTTLDPNSVIGGNNFPNPAPTGPDLGFENDGTCEFEGCGNVDFINSTYNSAINHFCILHPGICLSNNTPDLTYFASLTDDGSCTFEGCIDVSIDNNYVCNVMPAICDQNGALGVGINQNFSNNNNICQVVGGCTNAMFTPNLGGNYDPNANVDDGSCAITVCPDSSFDNWICNTPGYCDNVTNDYLTEYVHFDPSNQYGFGVGVTNANGTAFSSPIVVGTNYIEDIGVCENSGCTDDGQKDQQFWTDNGYDAITGTPNYPNFQPGNYNPQATIDDGSCNYFYNGYTDNNGDPVLDYEAVLGCTDDGNGVNDLNGDQLPALNFDPNSGANVDDGSCISQVGGCLDNGDIENYLFNASTNQGPYNAVTSNQDWWTGQNDSGTDYSANTGATNYPGVQASNFDQNANYDDGSCDYPEGCTDPLANNQDPNAIIDDGSCTYSYTYGCLEPAANNFDSTLANAAAPADDGSCVFTGCTDNAATIFNTQGSPGGQTVIDGNYTFNGVQLGDTAYWSQFLDTTTGQPLYPNGSPYLNLTLQPGNGHDDDGSCDFEGCLDPAYNDYICNDPTYGQYLCDNNQLGNSANGISSNQFSQPANACTDLQIEGCMDNTEGGTDPLNAASTGYLNNPDINGNMTCGPGGASPCLATNYNPNANIAGECNYNFCNQSNAYNFSSVDPLGNSWSNGSNGVTELCQYEGCTNNSAVAGALSTTVPNSSLQNPIYFYNAGNYGCQTSGGSNIDGMYFSNDLDPGNDDCCALGDCTDDGYQDQQWWDANGYSAPNVFGQGITVTSYPGAQATNYNPSANVDDGSCFYPLGCTDVGAPNYDSSAVIDDGTCLPYCKKIYAVQCNPSTYTPFTKHFMCAHISGDTPAEGDEFIGPGVSAEYGMPEDTPLQLVCPTFGATHDPNDPPFGGPGQFTGDTMTSTTAGSWGCTYMWNGSHWQLDPPGQTGYVEEPQKQAQVYKNQQAVFRVESIAESGGPLYNDFPSWNCNTPPPVPVGPGGPGKPFDTNGGIEKEPVRKSDITEVEISKKLREALKNMYK